MQNFDLSCGVQDLLPEQIEQWRFTTGVEFEFPVNRRWMLRAEAILGWGSELGAGDESAWIYGAGVKSRLAFQVSDYSTPNLLNGVLWTGYTPNRGRRESMSRLMTGVELIHPAGRWNLGGQRVDLKPHLLNYWYVNDVDVIFTQGDRPTALDSEWGARNGARKGGQFRTLGL